MITLGMLRLVAVITSCSYHHLLTHTYANPSRRGSKTTTMVSRYFTRRGGKKVRDLHAISAHFWRFITHLITAFQARQHTREYHQQRSTRNVAPQYIRYHNACSVLGSVPDTWNDAVRFNPPRVGRSPRGFFFRKMCVFYPSISRLF